MDQQILELIFPLKPLCRCDSYLFGEIFLTNTKNKKTQDEENSGIRSKFSLFGSNVEDMCDVRSDCALFIRVLAAVLPSLGVETVRELIVRGSSDEIVRGWEMEERDMKGEKNKEGEGEGEGEKEGEEARQLENPESRDIAEYVSLACATVRCVCSGYGALTSSHTQVEGSLPYNESVSVKDGNRIKQRPAEVMRGIEIEEQEDEERQKERGENGGEEEDDVGGTVSGIGPIRRSAADFIQSAAGIILSLAVSEKKESLKKQPETLKVVHTESAESVLTDSILEISHILRLRNTTSSASEEVFSKRICSAELLTVLVKNLLKSEGFSKGKILLGTLLHY